MATEQKIRVLTTVRLNREGGTYSNSRQYSQLLQDFISDLHQAEMELKALIRDLDFLAVLRPWL